MEFTAEQTGELTVLFRGRDGTGRSRHTFLQPTFGTDVAVTCAKHGGLIAERVELLRHVEHSLELQAGRGRKSLEEKTTLSVLLRPRHAGS